MNNWSELPSELLLLIAQHTTTKDLVTLKAVCTDWGATLKENVCLPSNQLPWLSLGKNPSCGFYSLSEGMFYQMDVPEAYTNRCCGSSQGRLIMSGKDPFLFIFMSGKDPFLFMLNPFTRSRIELPPVTSFPQVLQFCSWDVGREYECLAFGYKFLQSSEFMERKCMRKVILTGNPLLDTDYVALAICGLEKCLGFWRPGDDKWTCIEKSGGFDDVVYWEGVFYAMNGGDKLVQFDLSGSPAIARRTLLSSTLYQTFGIHNYLVVSSGELLLVVRMYDLCREEEFKDFSRCRGCCIDRDGTCYEDEVEDAAEDSNEDEGDHKLDDVGEEDESVDDDYEDDWDENDAYSTDEDCPGSFYRTERFKVYKPDVENQTWRRIRSIGDQILFVGGNIAMSFNARDFPECKPNHIYFTNNQTARGRAREQDWGAMDLETSKLQAFPGCSRLAISAGPAPVWLTPSLY